MNRSMIDLWVGVFVVVGFGALIFLALKVGNLASFSTDQTYQVHAKFANIGGLKVRAPVKSAGVVAQPPNTANTSAASAARTSMCTDFITSWRHRAQATVPVQGRVSCPRQRPC